MNDLDDIRIASLEEEDIQIIRELEKKLGDDICLVAVHKRDVIYALEAKMSPGEWQRVDEVYPEVKGLKAFYNQYETVKESKSALKRLLIANKATFKEKKRPIRIRQIVNSPE